MSLTPTNSEPSAYGFTGSNGIPTQGNVVITYPLAASASVSQGDWVKMSSTALNTIVKCTATSDAPIGVANTNADNSSGAVGDVKVGVLRRGFAYLDAVLSASGNSGPVIYFEDGLYLTGTNATEGQTLASTSTNNGNVIVARAFDAIPTMPSASTQYKIRVYLDRLSKSVMVE